jgi:hypothetical protein
MKKIFTLALFLILALAVVTSACKMPAPGGTPPPESEQTEAAEKPTREATAAEATSAPQDTSGGETTAVPPTATPLPAEPTATTAPTQVPPTATSVPPVATTVPLPANAQRIQFVYGATSATVAGELNGGASYSYVVNATAGQTMKVEVWSPNSDVYLSVLSSNSTVMLDGATHQTKWESVVNTTGDYYLTVTAGDGRTSYSVTVTIPTVATAQPTATMAPTSSAPAFNPYMTYGTPDFEDVMDQSSILDWANPDGTLPNTNEIRLFVDGDDFLVTGKVLDFSTWWFNWASLKNFYIEMTVDARTCAYQDAYGLILRGPAHEAGVSYGYVVAFTCDGKLWVYRLDSVKPWTSVDLVSPTVSPHIAQGTNAKNVIGVKADGDTITVYANGYQIAQVVDRYYLEGRYGLFVRPDITEYYTYESVKIAYWIFED